MEELEAVYRTSDKYEIYNDLMSEIKTFNDNMSSIVLDDDTSLLFLDQGDSYKELSNYEMSKLITKFKQLNQCVQDLFE